MEKCRRASCATDPRHIYKCCRSEKMRRHEPCADVCRAPRAVSLRTGGARSAVARRSNAEAQVEQLIRGRANHRLRGSSARKHALRADMGCAPRAAPPPTRGNGNAAARRNNAQTQFVLPIRARASQTPRWGTIRKRERRADIGRALRTTPLRARGNASAPASWSRAEAEVARLTRLRSHQWLCCETTQQQPPRADIERAHRAAPLRIDLQTCLPNRLTEKQCGNKNCAQTPHAPARRAATSVGQQERNPRGGASQNRTSRDWFATALPNAPAEEKC